MTKKNRWLVYPMLSVAALLWGGNVVFGRLAVGEISPLLLVSVRFLIVSVAMGLVFRHRLKRDWNVLRRHFPLLLLIAVCGFSGFTSLFYIGAHYTSGANMAIIPGATPFFVFLFARLIDGRRIGRWQGLGMALALAGVVVVACHGSFAELRRLQFNIGDLCLIAATCLYAVYTFALGRLPKEVDILSVFAVLAMLAFITSLPLSFYAVVHGQAGWPTLSGWGLAFAIALLPCFVAQIFYIRGIAIVGAGRAGIFNNLVPVFGAGLSVIFLGEAMGGYQMAGLALVMCGIIAVQIKPGP